MPSNIIARLTLCLIALLNSACSSSTDLHDTRFIMGTLVEFTISSADKNIDSAAAISAAANEMQRIEDAFTIYGELPNAVKRFNNTSPNTAIVLPQEVSQLLKLALDIQQQSHTAFDPALGALNVLWGFSSYIPPSSPPSTKAIQEAIPPSHCITQQAANSWIRTDTRCLLDFGAIAKGYAIDQGIKILRSYGINNAIINAGGDIRLIGKHGDRPWHIGIRHPRKANAVIATLELQGDVSIVTSGDYERFYIYQGKRYHHLINPKTGYPGHKAQSATIIASSATLADAWSTALFIQGKQGIPLQKRLNHQALLIDQMGQRHGELQ